MQLHQPQQVNYFTDVTSETIVHHNNKQLFTISKILFDKWLYYFLIMHFNLSQTLIIILNYNWNYIWQEPPLGEILEIKHFLQATNVHDAFQAATAIWVM